MPLPQELLQSLINADGFDKEAFEKVHASGVQITSIRINPAKPITQFTNNLINQSSIPWTECGFYLDQRPSFTFDPFFHAGCYYVQEASSMFLEQALKQTADLSKQLRVLDLCGSPGGKSTHIQSLLSRESLLVSNDVIRSRANVLKDNIIKWGANNVMVTNNDPKDFSQFENYFDVIVADAPCSGSGLFRRDREAINEWNEHTVQLCSQRQQRILADVWPALKRDGILIYSTCSYSAKEDEEIVNWFMNEFAAIYFPLTIPPEWNITDTGSGYRFWPDKVKGEGFFLACFKKKEGDTEGSIRVKYKPEVAGKKEMDLIAQWIKPGQHEFIKHGQTVYAWPAVAAADFSGLLQQLRVIYSGIHAGELMRDKLVPGHALAMSTLIAAAVNRTNLTYEQAIQYLQRKEFQWEYEKRGWQLVTYEDHPLGWVNVLANRVNNYYPKELRILKDSV